MHPHSCIILMFLSIAEMVKGRGKNARQTRNLLLKMSSDKLIGPLNVLKEWKIQQKRIKVRGEECNCDHILKPFHLSIYLRFSSKFLCRYAQEM